MILNENNWTFFYNLCSSAVSNFLSYLRFLDEIYFCL